MRRPELALRMAVVAIAVSAPAELRAQSSPSGRPDDRAPSTSGAAATDPMASMATARSARSLVRNGRDFIGYGEFERALELLREAEARQAELTDRERVELQKAIRDAREGLRTSDRTSRSPAARPRYGSARQAGSIALGSPAPRTLALPDEPVRLASAAAEELPPMPPGRAPAPPATAPQEAPALLDLPVMPAQASAPGAGQVIISQPLRPTRREVAPPPVAEPAPLALEEPAPSAAPPRAAEPEAVADLPAPPPPLVEPMRRPAPAAAPQPAVTEVPPATVTRPAAPEPTPAPAAPAQAPRPVPTAAPLREPAAPVVAAPEPVPAPTAPPALVQVPADTPVPVPAGPPGMASAPLPPPAEEVAPVTQPVFTGSSESPVPVPAADPSPAMPAASGLPAAPTGAAAAAGALNDDPRFAFPEPLQREVQELARRQAEERQRTAPPTASLESSLSSEAMAELGQSESRIKLPRPPSPTQPQPIRAVPVPENFVPLQPRTWSPNRKVWAAAATCHGPLYFQDPVLERYGQSVEQAMGPHGRFLAYPIDKPSQSKQRNQLLQPFVSLGIFAAQIAALPYNMVVDPPWESEYDLGYYRPGDRIPPDTYYLPWHGVGPPLQGRDY